MNKFTILLVDDEEKTRKQFHERFGADPQYKLLIAGTVDAARNRVAENFLHVAFIDMQIGTDEKGGLEVAKLIASWRPSCRSYLITSYLITHPDEVSQLLDPLNPTIRGALQKQDFAGTWEGLVRPMARRWLASQFNVQGAERVFESLKEKLTASGFESKAELTCEEVDYAVSMLFGQGRETAVPPKKRDEYWTEFELSHIELSMLTGGRSSSVLAQGRPSSKNGRQGIWSVIKFSPREEALEEFERYCRFVRFMLSLDTRVELLGFVDADTIGAMCYSFAGKSPANVTSLDKLFRDQSGRASGVLSTIFKVDQRSWYEFSGPLMEIGNFFSNEYWFRTHAILEKVNGLIQDVSNSIPGSKRRGNSTELFGTHIRHAEEAIKHPITRDQLKTTVVHGDMNANNIMVSNDDRVILIDYRHTGYGPRALDFAAVECSARLAMKDEEREDEAVIRCHALEAKVWAQVWDTSLSNAAGQPLPFWARTSMEIGGFARANFPDIEPAEYAITCLFWGLRVFRVRDLEDSAKLRLLVWISHLTQVICGPL